MLLPIFDEPVAVVNATEVEAWATATAFDAFGFTAGGK